jgi:4-hydroxy-tetrahydrodipicolinate synthase
MFVPGAVAMLVTPFAADGLVDLEAMRRVARLALDQGAAGLAVHGLASEGYKLLDRERVEIVEAVAEVNTTPLLLAGVDHEATAGSVALARAVGGAGATAVMAMPPKSSGGARGRLVDYFARLEGESGLPVVIQDAPRASGIAMDAETLAARVGALEGPSAIKVEDAIPPLKIARLAGTLPDRSCTYGGAGGRRYLAELEAGAIGTMVGPAYVDLFAYLTALHGTDRAAAEEVFEGCLALIHSVEGNEWYALLQKQLLLRAGLIGDATLRPPAVVAEAGYMDGLVGVFLRTAARQPHVGEVLMRAMRDSGR